MQETTVGKSALPTAFPAVWPAGSDMRGRAVPPSPLNERDFERSVLILIARSTRI